MNKFLTIKYRHQKFLQIAETVKIDMNKYLNYKELSNEDVIDIDSAIAKNIISNSDFDIKVDIVDFNNTYNHNCGIEISKVIDFPFEKYLTFGYLNNELIHVANNKFTHDTNINFVHYGSIIEKKLIISPRKDYIKRKTELLEQYFNISSLKQYYQFEDGKLIINKYTYDEISYITRNSDIINPR